MGPRRALASQSPNPMKQRLLWGIVLALLLAHAAAFLRYTIDDAYITFACAKNLAAGEGPVFVPGEHVESTSSMLWAVLLAPFEAVGLGAPTGSKILGVACVLLALFFAVKLLVRMRPAIRPGEQVAAGLLIAVSSPFVVWSVYGMENGLAALLLVSAAYLFEGERRAGAGWRSAVPIMLLETARPEGFMFVAFFLLLRFVHAATDAPNRRGYLMPWLAVLLAPLAAYEIGGLLYFGHLLPNTVAAKVGMHLLPQIKHGLLYLVRGRSAVLTYTFLAALVLAVPALFATARRLDRAALAEAWRRHGGYLTVIGLVALQMLFAVLVGGDWMPNGRFLSHAAPLIVIALVYGYSVLAAGAREVSGVLPGIAPSLRLIATCALLFLIGYNVHTSERSIHGPVGELQASEDSALAGEVAYLDSVGTPNDVVACSDIGRVGYYFRGRVLDWWGLANEEVTSAGEALGNIRAETVLRHRPRFIVLYATEPTLTPETMGHGMATYSKPFLASREFRMLYHQVRSFKFAEARYHVVFERVR